MKNNEAKNFATKALACIEKGDHDQALDNFTKALEIYREINDKKNEVIVLADIGNIYRIKGDRKNALKYFEEAIERSDINNTTKDNKGELIYFYKDKLTDADERLEYFQEALKYQRYIRYFGP